MTGSPWTMALEPPAAFGEIYPHYLRDFPAPVRKSRALAGELLHRGHYRIVTARRRDDASLAAYAMGYPVNGGRCFWLDFFAVVPERRGAGLGEWFLRNLPRVLPMRGMFLEIEFPETPDQQKRVRFYKRMGAFPLPLDYALLPEGGGLLPMMLYYLPCGPGRPDGPAVARAVTTTFEHTYGVMPEPYPHWRERLDGILATLREV